MKLFSKLLILVVLAAMVGPFFIKGADGAPLWRWQDTWAAVNQWRSDVISDTTSIVVPDSAAVTVYRWQDASGQWHFSNEAPSGAAFDELLIDPKTNLVRAKAASGPAEPDVAIDADAPSAHVSPLLPLPDPETTKQLMQDVRELQEMADERQAELDAL